MRAVRPPAPAAAPGPVHATAIARHGRDGWRGVLLTGPSGSGKSDLALRLIERGWRLVADDYCEVWASDGVVWAAAPPRIAGLLEARGLGIIPSVPPPLPLARIALVAACGQVPVERLPQPDTELVAGIALPRVVIDIRPASAPETLQAALKVTLDGLDVAPL